jgi:calcineurin-like phosphoesterase
MIRSVLIVITSVAVTVFMSCYIIAFSFIRPDENISHRVAKIWAKMLLFLTNTTVEIIGVGKYPDGKAADIYGQSSE